MWLNFGWILDFPDNFSIAALLLFSVFYINIFYRYLSAIYLNLATIFKKFF